jgi:hypothetical protein
MPKPEKEAFPRPSKRPDGSYIYERVQSAATLLAATTIAATPTTSHPQMLYKKVISALL